MTGHHELILASPGPDSKSARTFKKRGTSLYRGRVDRARVFDSVTEKLPQQWKLPLVDVSRSPLEAVVAQVREDHKLRLTTCQTIPMEPRGRYWKRRPNTALLNEFVEAAIRRRGDRSPESMYKASPPAWTEDDE